MIEIETVGPDVASPLAREEFVRTRDGVRLATDVYLPDGDETPGGTILVRLPYDKRGKYTFLPLIAEYFMARGWRVVVQDVRGKFRSEGEALLFVHEPDDGYDTIEWIINQRWSDGNVAMWGDSYYGYTQWAAVTAQHPALKAIAPRVTGTQLGEPVHLNTGAPNRRVEWPITLLYPLTYFHGNDTAHWRMDWSQHPYAEQCEQVVTQLGARSISYDQWYPSPVYLRRFPLASAFDARPVPVLHTIGWWDNCAPLSWADEAEILRRPAWLANRYLRIEPTDHENDYLNEATDTPHTITEESIRAGLPRYLDPALDFFDVFVRGLGSPTDIPRVTWSVGGTDEWRTDSSWPPAGTQPGELHATAAGTLSRERPVEATEATWLHDPLNPVPSSVENAFAYLETRLNEAPLGERSDVLCFRSEPLTGPVTLAGPVSVDVTAWSDGPKLAVFARLLDEAPDGTALRIARGQVHIENAVAPTSITIGMDHIGYVLEAGHRLRLHVSSSDAPEFDTEPGTGVHPWAATEFVTNRQYVHLGGADGLRVNVTVLEGTLR